MLVLTDSRAGTNHSATTTGRMGLFEMERSAGRALPLRRLGGLLRGRAIPPLRRLTINLGSLR